MLVEAAAYCRRIIWLPYAEGTQPELDPWFLCLNTLVEPLNEDIYSIPAPVGARQLSAASLVSLPALVVREILEVIIIRIWIKIVVKMYSVEVIPAHQVHDHVVGVILRPLQGRVHPPVVLNLEFKHQVRTLFND